MALKKNTIHLMQSKAEYTTLTTLYFSSGGVHVLAITGLPIPGNWMTEDDTESLSPTELLTYTVNSYVKNSWSLSIVNSSGTRAV